MIPVLFQPMYFEHIFDEVNTWPKNIIVNTNSVLKYV